MTCRRSRKEGITKGEDIIELCTIAITSVRGRMEACERRKEDEKLLGGHSIHLVSCLEKDGVPDTVIQ